MPKAKKTFLSKIISFSKNKEQVLDRQDTNEEECLLAAIEEVADEEHACFSEFSSSHKAFKELIKKVKSWKKKCRLIPVLTERYLKRKLLKFFSTYDRTEDSEKTLLNLSFKVINLSFLQFIPINVSDTFLVVSSCFPQVSSSYLVMLAHGGL